MNLKSGPSSLVPLLPLYLPAYEREQGRLPTKTVEGSCYGAGQVDRLPPRRKDNDERRRWCGTKLGRLLKDQNPIRTIFEEMTAPGWLEADSVAHFGGSLEGCFIWSVIDTDIYSGWNCMRKF